VNLWVLWRTSGEGRNGFALFGHILIVSFRPEGSENFGKISWIKWDIICLNKEKGGLVVRRMREFNLDFLRK
jgi:hypothetical protein